MLLGIRFPRSVFGTAICGNGSCESYRQSAPVTGRKPKAAAPGIAGRKVLEVIRILNSQAGTAKLEYALLASLLLLTVLVAVGRIGQSAKGTFELAANRCISLSSLDGGTQGGVGEPQYSLPICEDGMFDGDGPFSGK